MTFKRITCFIICAVMLLSMTVMAHADNEQSVDTVQRFLAMTTGNYILTENIDLTDADITSAALENFSGTLDGNGYTVTVDIDTENNSKVYAGLFGKLTGTVKNLRLEGSISVKAISNTVYVYAGGIAGLNTGVIENCVSYADVSVTGGTEVYAGGISGINREGSNVGRVISDYNYGDITVTGQKDGVESAGGISGGHGKLEACKNYGKVTVNGNESLMSYGAGIAAYDGDVKFSENHGKIDITSSMQAYAGGIVSFLDSASITFVQNCANYGEVTAKVSVPETYEEGTSATAGGVVGYLAGYIDFTEDGEVDISGCSSFVRNCLNGGKVSALLTKEEAGNSYAGGIAGVVNGALYNCVNEAKTFSAKYYGPVFASVNPTEILRGTAYDCYTLSALANTLITAANTVADVTTVTDVQYKTESTYKNFDFENVWKIEADKLLIQVPDHNHFNIGDYHAATCTTDAWLDAVCELCGLEHIITFKDTARTHNPDDEWITDESGHWHICLNNECSDKVDFKSHTYGDFVSDNNATVYENGTKTRVCSICQFSETVEDKGSKLPSKPKYNFSDVKESSWYYDVVNYAAQNGLMTGTGESTFDPNVNLNRATFVTVLAKVEGVFDSLTTDTKTEFSDVPAGKWYTGTVKWAASVGVTDGMGDGTFAPMKEITREQMCTMFGRYIGYRKITLNTKVNKKESFKDDKEISSWAKSYVYDCQMAGIVNGMGDGTFAPKGTANRAQAAKIFTVFHQNYLAK